MEIVKLLIENPGSGVVMLISGISFIFYLGTIYNRLKALQASVVTKEDLKIALMEMSKDFNETFVRKDECERLLRRTSRLHEA